MNECRGFVQWENVKHWMVVAGLTLLMMLQRSVHSHTAAWLQLQLQKSGDKLKVDKVTSWLRVTVWK